MILNNTKPTHLVAHFIFSNHTMPTLKNAKEPPSQRTKDTVNDGQQSIDRKEAQLVTASTKSQLFILQRQFCGYSNIRF